jgi:phage shock protein PspC (stress-responsive transcriptional regulator)
MNKTVTINVSGIVFHINEDAYDTLNNYIVSIRAYVSGTPDSAEIMGDIEARIAELLQQSLNENKQVVTMTDIDHVKSILGQPEDFASEQQETAASVKSVPVKKRLFRDPDEKVIGGVCAGLAAYFDIDKVWVRLVMVILTFFGGLSVWVYLIMWMVMPVARTSAEKAAMRGESGDINSIMRSFREEAGEVKNRFSRHGKIASDATGVMNAVFVFLVRLFGAFLLVVGCLLMVGFLTTVLGISIMTENTWVANWKEALLDSPSSYFLGLLSYILVIGIPVSMIIYTGVKLLFRLKYSNRWMNTTLGLLWLTGLICGLYITGRTFSRFSESSKLRKSERVAVRDSMITIKLNPVSNVLKDLDGPGGDIEEVETQHDYLFKKTKGQLRIVGFAKLYISETDGDSVVVSVNREARGAGSLDANMNARDISYHYSADGGMITLDQVFLTSSRFHAQEVEVRIGIPRGKVVYFDANTKYALVDADNTSNVWAGRLAGRKWRMTDSGLACIDCAGLDEDEPHHRHRHHGKKHNSKITINDHGIHVEDEDGLLKIDDSGIIISDKK